MVKNMMYAKAFASMYEGSMVGAGIAVFAVWNYAITKCFRGYVELNPKLLAMVLGGKESEVAAAIEFLTSPDEGSRSQEAGGARLVKDGQFQYRVVNWDHYQRIRNESERREYNRIQQANYRARKRRETGLKTGSRKGMPLKGESSHVRALENGWEDETGEPIKTPEPECQHNDIILTERGGLRYHVCKACGAEAEVTGDL